MKLNCFYSFLAAAGLLCLASACSDDDYSLDAASVTPDQLVQGNAFEVKPDAENPNVIHLTSKLKGVTPLWVTPQGRSQSSDYTIDLPFAGDYEVTFGVMTQAGPVYGNPYKFNIPQNDFSMLSDAIWTNLAGGVDENGNGNPKKWVPMDKSYGVGYGSSPVMYLDPDHINNDGVENKDLLIGSENWTPNWDPGFQDWLVPATDPYMGSYMIFGLDPVKGCTLKQMRNTASGEEVVEGTFSLNISDPKRPTVTFNGGTYAMHTPGFDGVCDNYTQDIKILECTPYVLQFATMRTNSEGPWWLVWNFVAADVQDGTVTIPLGPELIEEAKPVFPKYEDYYKNDILEKLLFTVQSNEINYEAAEVVYNLDEETPYDILQWDGTNGNEDPANWKSQGLYGTIDLPVYEGDFALTLTRSGLKAAIENDKYVGYAGDAFNTSFTAADGQIHFNDYVTLLQAGNVKIEGTDFRVFKCSVDDGLVIGVPYGSDQNGTVNRYIVLNLVPKSIGGGATGPKVIPVDNSVLEGCLDGGNANCYRIELFNAWGGDKTWPVNIADIKVKKKQVLKIAFKIDGLEWAAGAAPKAILCHNIGAGLWPGADGAGFNDATAVTVNTAAGGETTLIYDNTNGGGAVTFDAGCLSICIQQTGLVASPLDADGNVDAANVTPVITSITIE